MKFTGSCHCQRVRYEAELDLSKEVISCNCSICSRKGSLLAFTPDDQFKLLSGETSLADYQFGKKSIHHYFCSTCGVTSFASGKKPGGETVRAINVRCLEGVNLDSVKIKKFDGKSL